MDYIHRYFNREKRIHCSLKGKVAAIFSSNLTV